MRAIPPNALGASYPLMFLIVAFSCSLPCVRPRLGGILTSFFSCSIIVQIPIDLSPDPELSKLEEKGVKASYVSVEQLTELNGGSEGGKVRWTMATSSHPGGMIPDAITNASLAGEIAKVSAWRWYVRRMRC